MTGAPSLSCFCTLFCSVLCIVTISNLLYLYWHLASHILHHQFFLFFTTAKKMEKWECFQRSRAVPTLWEEREREQALPTQPLVWCPALGLRLRSLTPRRRSSVQTVSFSESYPKVFNYLASFIEGGNPSVTTLGHTKDNHSPEQSFYQLCRGMYTSIQN